MKKILLLCQQCTYSIDLSPARYQLIHELRERNYEIFVFIPSTIVNKKIRNEIQHLTNTKYLSCKEIRNKIVNIAPRYVIAFTDEDAQILYPLPWIMRKTSFIYYNLEIYTLCMEQNRQSQGAFYNIRCRIIYIKNKIKEIIFTRGCKLFSIQDNLRKRVSAKHFISHTNTLLIPNSYILHNQCGIKKERHGIIYSGGLNKLQLESLMEELYTAPDLPITFSGWCDNWFLIQYKKVHMTHPSVQICRQKLPEDEYSNYLLQFAVGLIWYSPTKDENVDNIGLSSGKFFKHLSLGQPVIVKDCPGISNIVRKYRLGLVIHNASELKEAYDHIMQRYSYYVKNVQSIYKHRYDYQKIIQPFLSMLEEM